MLIWKESQLFHAIFQLIGVFVKQSPKLILNFSKVFKFVQILKKITELKISVFELSQKNSHPKIF